MILAWPQITLIIWSLLSVGHGMGSIPEKGAHNYETKCGDGVKQLIFYTFLNAILYRGGFYTS